MHLRVRQTRRDTVISRNGLVSFNDLFGVDTCKAGEEGDACDDTRQPSTPSTRRPRVPRMNGSDAAPNATLDDLREAVTMLEDTTRTARRVLGSAHPHVADIAEEFQWARETLSAGETPRGVGVEEDDDDSDEWETVSSEEAPTVATS